MYQGITIPLTIVSAGPEGDCSTVHRGWQGGMGASWAARYHFLVVLEPCRRGGPPPDV